MPREIDLSKPLSAEDIAYLKSRYPKNYVDRQIELAGGVSTETPAKGESSEEATGEAQGQPEGSEAASGAESDADEALEAEDEASDEDDLIGELYDPLAHTTTEVRAYLKGADDAERDRVKAVEAARTDREARTSITEF